MRRLELQDQIFSLETIYEDLFRKPPKDWVAEGGADIAVHDGRLFMNAAKERLFFLTMWCKREFEGDALIEYTARVELGSPDTNLNFILYGANPDGSSVLTTSSARTGEYSEYHALNNYIFTYLNEKPVGAAEEKTRVRFRENPGFHLVQELWLPPIVRGRDYAFAIAVQGQRLRLYADQQLLVDYTESERGDRHGHHAFRTYKSHISAALFRVSRIAAPA